MQSYYRLTKMRFGRICENCLDVIKHEKFESWKPVTFKNRREKGLDCSLDVYCKEVLNGAYVRKSQCKIESKKLDDGFYYEVLTIIFSDRVFFKIILKGAISVTE